jgi:hypothetical protein
MIADGPRGVLIKTPSPQIVEIIALDGTPSLCADGRELVHHGK